ncbi:MAG: DUF1843 domain-containing protein [Acidobacteriota bacterium]|nr:DUF1843 domain-containing protein [Acidobacteriota bacterium]
MPTLKKASGTKSARPGKGSTKSTKSAVRNGPVPPYGVAIREAIARGDIQQMRKLAVSTRKWLRDVQTALNRLEKAIGGKGGRS